MRAVIQNLPGSKIREVANAAMAVNNPQQDVLAFWFGESDEPTPELIKDAAMESLARGETFYSHNLGLPELRHAIAQYTSGLHGNVDVDRIAVTSSGVSALMVAMQMLAGAGDEVVVVVPVWPNLTAQPAILGARVRCVSLRPAPAPATEFGGAWTLDMAELLAAVTATTRVLLLNAPNNPTGWTLSRDEQQTLLEHCRRTGTWIVADEVYERLFYGAASLQTSVQTSVSATAQATAAPSFLDIATADDRLIVAHSFSKSFLMTGWRLGWLVLPNGHLDAAGKLIEYNSSCAPVFVQRGGLAGLGIADVFVPGLVARLQACRDRLVAGLQQLPGVEVALPPGGMYAFFRVQGETDSLRFAKHLVSQHGLGLAPGVAFGDSGEGWLRWCFASHNPARLDRGLERLAAALRR